jgi:hypothetical protein
LRSEIGIKLPEGPNQTVTEINSRRESLNGNAKFLHIFNAILDGKWLAANKECEIWQSATTVNSASNNNILTLRKKHVASRRETFP